MCLTAIWHGVAPQVIRRQRAERRKAKKAAEAEAQRASAESAAAVARGEGASSSRAQDGDTARFDWAAFAQGGRWVRRGAAAARSDRQRQYHIQSP